MRLQTAADFFVKVRGLKLAYHRVFDDKNQYTKMVLEDLAKFCRAHTSTFNADPRVHAMLEGRREVWLKIAEQLNLTEDQIYDLHTIKQVQPGEKK